MDGKIYFDNLEQLGEFLKAFTGSTAKFEVQHRNNQWVLEFYKGF
jgi:hypothetical protein